MVFLKNCQNAPGGKKLTVLILTAVILVLVIILGSTSWYTVNASSSCGYHFGKVTNINRGRCSL
jgi:hypothetical protein